MNPAIFTQTYHYIIMRSSWYEPCPSICPSVRLYGSYLENKKKAQKKKQNCCERSPGQE